MAASLPEERGSVGAQRVETLGSKRLSASVWQQAFDIKDHAMASLHDFEMNSIEGESVKLSQFENQVCLIVNVASE